MYQNFKIISFFSNELDGIAHLNLTEQISVETLQKNLMRLKDNNTSHLDTAPEFLKIGMGNSAIAYAFRSNDHYLVRESEFENSFDELKLQNKVAVWGYAPKIHQSIVVGNRSFLVMDKVDGFNLSKIRLERSFVGTIKILIKLTHILKRLESNHIIHGDLHTENVIVDKHGNPILIDFERARINTNNDCSQKRQLGHLIYDTLKGLRDPNKGYSLDYSSLYAKNLSMFILIPEIPEYEAYILAKLTSDLANTGPKLPMSYDKVVRILNDVLVRQHNQKSNCAIRTL